jgi:hypothetical protein
MQLTTTVVVPLGAYVGLDVFVRANCRLTHPYTFATLKRHYLNYLTQKVLPDYVIEYMSVWQYLTNTTTQVVAIPSRPTSKLSVLSHRKRQRQSKKEYKQ